MIKLILLLKSISDTVKTFRLDNEDKVCNILSTTRIHYMLNSRNKETTDLENIVRCCISFRIRLKLKNVSLAVSL